MLSAIIITSLTLRPGPTQVVLGGLDPVELASGKEVAGKPQLSTKHIRFEYQFANAANKQLFDADPLKFAVQNGGACGSMGPLSGRGSPTRWAVHEGKIFLFASEGCRKTFLKNPKSYVQVGAPYVASEDSDPEVAKKRWKEILAAHNAGGLGKLKSLSWTRITPYDDAGQKKQWLEHEGIFGEQSWGSWYSYDKGAYGYFANGHDRWEVAQAGIYAVHPSEEREVRAAVVRTAQGLIGGAPVTPVAVSSDGMTVTVTCGDLVFDVIANPTTQRIASLRFEDRFAARFSKVELQYPDYKVVEGVYLPSKVVIQLEGKQGRTVSIDRYEVNGIMPAWAKP